MARPLGQVYGLDDDDAVCRYSGDPDEFTALVQHWLLTEMDGCYDTPIGVLPPVPQLFRTVPDGSGEYGWLLRRASRPGRGVWTGAMVELVVIGCRQCQGVGGYHAEDCLNAHVVGLQTCQLTAQHLTPGMQETIHLVRVRGRQPGRNGGTPGPTLCDLDRFAPGMSFSMGGGYTTAGMKLRACRPCTVTARRLLPGRPVQTSMREFARLFADVGMRLTDNWQPQPLSSAVAV